MKLCTDCGDYLDAPEEQELGVCEKCLKKIRKSEGRCPDCGEYTCCCKPGDKDRKLF